MGRRPGGSFHFPSLGLSPSYLHYTTRTSQTQSATDKPSMMTSQAANNKNLPNRERERESERVCCCFSFLFCFLFFVEIRSAQQFDYSDCVLNRPFFFFLFSVTSLRTTDGLWCVVYCYWVATKQQLHSDVSESYFDLPFFVFLSLINNNTRGRWLVMCFIIRILHEAVAVPDDKRANEVVLNFFWIPRSVSNEVRARANLPFSHYKGWLVL